MKYYSKNLTNMYFSFITMLYSLIEIMNNVVTNNVSRVLAILFITVQEGEGHDILGQAQGEG